MHKPDMTGHDGRISVGWLHPDFEFSKGAVPADFLVRIKEFSEKCGPSIEALGLGAAGGYYPCQFCRNFATTGIFGVPDGERIFFAPKMIAHYIEEHNYAPPAEFIAAVLACPLPGTKDYEIAAAPFRPQRPQRPKKNR